MGTSMAAVAGDLLDDVRRHAFGQQERDAGVSQVVEP
jgi:hypothetical protein